jgi:hypothetical protein
MAHTHYSWIAWNIELYINIRIEKFWTLTVQNIQ